MRIFVFLFFFFFPKLEKNLFEEVLVNITNPEMMMCVYIYISFSREHSTSDPHWKTCSIFIYLLLYLLWSIKGNEYCIDPFVEGNCQKQMYF